MEKIIHHGRNIERFRKMLDIKQDTLASLLGEDWTQKKISLLESKQEIEDGLLEQVAKALKVPAEAIKNFDEEAAVNIIANTINNHDQAAVINYYPSFNPVDKVVALLEKIIKEKDEIIAQLQKKKK